MQSHLRPCEFLGMLTLRLRGVVCPLASLVLQVPLVLKEFWAIGGFIFDFWEECSSNQADQVGP